MNDPIQRVTMPKWGLSMSTGKVVDWLVGEGEDIRPGTDLVDIETDKIAGTLESSQEGVLRRIVAAEGRDIPVGGVIALVAPADVPDSEIEAAAAEAEEALASGEVEPVAGPVQSNVEVDGRRLSYATLGEGDEVVVLVHGFGGDANSWLFLQEPLAEGRTVHALDLPGHGASSKDVGDGSIDTLAGAVVGFLDALGIGRAHLIGHSLGGAVVATAADSAPMRVASLTLVAPIGLGTSLDVGYLRGFAAASSRRELRPQLGKLFADPGQVTRRLVDDVLKYKRLDGVDQALSTLLTTVIGDEGQGKAQAVDISDVVSRLDVPATVIWGDQDVIVAPLPEGVLSDKIPVQIVEKSGHMVHMERPGDLKEKIERVIS